MPTLSLNAMSSRRVLMDQKSGQNGKRRQMEAFAIDDAVDKRVRERIERVLLPGHVGCKTG